MQNEFLLVKFKLREKERVFNQINALDIFI